MIESFSKVRDLHTCSKVYVADEVAKNNKQLNENIASNTARCIKNADSIEGIRIAISQPIGKPKPMRHIAPCLDVS